VGVVVFWMVGKNDDLVLFLEKSGYRREDLISSEEFSDRVRFHEGLLEDGVISSFIPIPYSEILGRRLEGESYVFFVKEQAPF